MICIFCKQQTSSPKVTDIESSFDCVNCDTEFYFDPENNQLISFYMYVKINNVWYSWDYFDSNENIPSEIMILEHTSSDWMSYQKINNWIKDNKNYTISGNWDYKQIQSFIGLTVNYISPATIKNKIQTILTMQ